ncbi:hypothetical protein [uncultured Thiodictyon sp.]|uniref:hypothetical protein n=1 Tax=uncultured Thiodictyon sp. TaxID=1846217 RepID=UPI0025DDB626|nr:hypothetical protein [uncultured Thiodictyon sp.]
MPTPFVMRSTALSSLALLCSVTLLSGCACDPTQGAWHPSGRVQTKGGKPFYLSTKTQKLLIAPGRLVITPVDNNCAPRLEIGNGTDQIALQLHAGELTRNEIRIVGVTHGLSANIVGNWTDIPQGRPHESYTTESCTTYGYCSKQETEKECHDGKCKTETHTRHRHYPDCPGSRPVTIRYDYFKRAYRLAFLNPQNTREKFGTYEGVTEPFEAEIERLTGACMAY